MADTAPATAAPPMAVDAAPTMAVDAAPTTAAPLWHSFVAVSGGAAVAGAVSAIRQLRCE